MTFNDYLMHWQPILKNHIIFFLKSKKKKSKIPLYRDSIFRLIPFVTSGKLLRGILIILSSEMFNRKVDEDVLNTASALELAHSALLIHDDIIDRDKVRRGQKTIFSQYIDYAKRNGIKDPNSYGQSMGICVGDIAFFLAFELIGKSFADPLVQQKLLGRFSEVMQTVGTGEMLDLETAMRNNNPTVEEIYDIYRYKTARYTFSLPLTLGAILASANNSTIKKLEKLGELLGIIFQIKDDEMGIFGDEKTIGKPAGGDIRENKKTLFRSLLYAHVTEKGGTFLNSYFGNPRLKSRDIAKIQRLMNKYKVREIVEKELKILQKESLAIIKHLSPAPMYKKLLRGFVEYNITRNK